MYSRPGDPYYSSHTSSNSNCNHPPVYSSGATPPGTVVYVTPTPMPPPVVVANPGCTSSTSLFTLYGNNHHSGNQYGHHHDHHHGHHSGHGHHNGGHHW